MIAAARQGLIYQQARKAEVQGLGDTWGFVTNNENFLFFYLICLEIDYEDLYILRDEFMAIFLVKIVMDESDF